MPFPNIQELIVSEENTYQTSPITVIENYEWSMAEHIKLSSLYKNSTYKTGKDDNKPFKNIVRPILNLAYRAEGFDVKDVVLFVNDSDYYYKSFLVKKFHEKWARENNIDTFIDEMVESYCDFGGALVKNVNGVRPEVVPLQRLAFCDQTDILKGVICEKHFYAPDELKEFESKGWKNIDDVIVLAQNEKKNSPVAPNRTVKTPGKYIEVYEVHGVFPEYWLLDGNNGKDSDKLVRQLHIVTFYTGETGEKNGITLYKGIEKELPYKLLLRDAIYGRALGLGGIEELFEDQVWTNYDMIRMKGMLDIASKVIFQTADTAFSNRNKTMGLDNGEILITEPNMPISQINTFPVNLSIFERSVSEWESHARETGSATGALMGENQGGSRQSYNSIALITSQGQAIHDYRKGKIATFLDEIYREWIIPHIAKEICNNSQHFLSNLTVDEMIEVGNQIAENITNRTRNEQVLSGETPTDKEILKQQILSDFQKQGNKRFIDILKKDFEKDAPLDVFVSIVGKQKDLGKVVDQMNNIVRQIISSANPQTGQSVLDDPRMAKIFNQIWESAGLSPIDMSTPFVSKPVTQAPPQQTLPQPIANQPTQPIK